MRKKIVSTAPLVDWVTEELIQEFELQIVAATEKPELVAAMGPDVAAIIVPGPLLIDAEVMDAAPNLQVIARTGVGFDTVDIEEASARKIPVTYTPGVLSRAVAEHAVALILAAAKILPTWQRVVLEGKWEDRYCAVSRDLEGATLGIVGLGRIGREVWKLMRPFDTRFLAYDPYLTSSSFQADGISSVTLEELLESSDVVTLHVPLTEVTQAMIHTGNIAQFKERSILVNTSRGAVVESHDLLYHALQNGPLGCVALDTFVEEPPDTSHPLFQHPQVILSPHVASRTPQAKYRVYRTMLDDLKTVLSGSVPRLDHVVNAEVYRSKV